MSQILENAEFVRFVCDGFSLRVHCVICQRHQKQQEHRQQQQVDGRWNNNNKYLSTITNYYTNHKQHQQAAAAIIIIRVYTVSVYLYWCCFCYRLSATIYIRSNNSNNNVDMSSVNDRNKKPEKWMPTSKVVCLKRWSPYQAPPIDTTRSYEITQQTTQRNTNNIAVALAAAAATAAPPPPSPQQQEDNKYIVVVVFFFFLFLLNVDELKPKTTMSVCPSVCLSIRANCIHTTYVMIREEYTLLLKKVQTSEIRYNVQ